MNTELNKNTNAVVADDELEVVAGGLGSDADTNLFTMGTRVRFIDGTVCPKCKCPNGVIAWSGAGGARRYVRCEHCGTTIVKTVNDEKLEQI